MVVRDIFVVTASMCDKDGLTSLMNRERPLAVERIEGQDEIDPGQASADTMSSA